MNPTTFDLNLIRALDALLTTKNVTHAAGKLHVTQQAMSGSLRRLRSHFADDLLVSVGRRLELTPLAAALKESVHELMLQFERTLELTPEFDAFTSARHFRLAISDYAAIVVLPVLMPLLAVQAPRIVCEFKPIDNSVFEEVEQGNLDFCLLPSNWRLYQSTHPAGLQSLSLFDDDFVCVVAADNTVVGDQISLDEYQSLGHAAVEFGNRIRSMVENAWILAELDIAVVATTTNFASLLYMVPGTRLIATAQRRLAKTFAGLLPIRIVECPVAIEMLHEDLSWHQRHDLDPAHRFVRGLFNDVATRLATPQQ